MSNNMELPPVSQPSSSPVPAKPDTQAPLKSAMKKISKYKEEDNSASPPNIKGKVKVDSSEGMTKAQIVKKANEALRNEIHEDSGKEKTQKLRFNEEKNSTHSYTKLNEEISKKESEENEFANLIHSGTADISDDGSINLRAPLTKKSEVEKLLSDKVDKAFLIFKNGKGENVLALNQKQNDKMIVKYIKFEVTKEGQIKEDAGKIHANFLKFLTANNTNKSKGIKEAKADAESNKLAEASEVKSLKDRSISLLNKIISGGKSFGSAIYGLAVRIKESAGKIFEDKSLKATSDHVYNRKSMKLPVIDQTHQPDNRAKEIQEVLRQLGF